ncbi:putative sulfate exporter family transporter [Phototrophicus methaneseepsis]|uniref:Putative sulfate exporter family transporter n=1 Tax=Phototrophicus methaneseepsis TaxID=2710758 RepID=A0A7S8ICI6_9CHLR|nr:putative sulfate exporter family transporter [Phototrophicus methaneseepsis]QPC80521.1 putative sulfate exporter family transporter [Phototrophicus methaneseepsis]
MGKRVLSTLPTRGQSGIEASSGSLPLLRRLLPGLFLALLISIFALVIFEVEKGLFEHAVIEGLVIAILLGMAWRTLFGVPEQANPGVKFASKQVLEMAIVLLGVSVDLPAIVEAGWPLFISVMIAVSMSLTISTLLGRALGLRPKLATLVAVGNSICGNSAIGAVAPIIDAEPEDITSSIALANVLGIAEIILLPSLIPLLGLTLTQYGILAGLSVYAVPQVVAATFSVSAVSGQMGTMVKLVRVLLLGPVALFFSLRYASNQPGQATGLHKITRFIPWFILGFVLLAAMRSIGLLPLAVVEPLRGLSSFLTVVAMAALGLNVDVRSVRQVGGRVAIAVIGSFVALVVLSLLLIAVFQLG